MLSIMNLESVFHYLCKKNKLIYPSNIENKLGFDTIRQLLKSECISPLGEKLIDNINFKINFTQINTLLDQTEEFRQILLFDDSFPSQDYFDLTHEIDRIRVIGTFISQQPLFELKLSLSTIIECLNYLKSDTEEIKYPELNKLTQNVFIDTTLIKNINRIIDEKGEIKDDASSELKSIRKALKQKSVAADKKLNQTLNQAKKEGWTSDEVTVTIRNGRAVIPVNATNKRKIRGFVHDASATGQTFYIEPEEVFELNNEIRELQNDERLEIIRILIEFTDSMRPFSYDLKNAYYFLSLMDFIRAKAKFAISIEAVKPLVNKKPIIDWYNAKHPLLFLSHKAQKKPVETLKISFNNKDRILIISGPNAGGKSVCLKTVGILQYMLQCGLLVPMKETSETGIFENIFIDIGDEQSIENDLSTYSSHLLNMKTLVDKVSSDTLFLIDEFGSGTEPQLGGAIAEAILEHLNNKKAYGVVTTHYSNLKLMAEKNEGVVNGAMLYDTNQMRPLYKLSIGKPGSSFAFEIAKNIGLQKEILDNASRKSGKSHLNFESQLQQLEVDKVNIAHKEAELKMADNFLAEIIDKYQKLSDELETNKKAIIKQAKDDAKELIRQSNRLIENAIRTIKESNADKDVTKEARESLEKYVKKLDPVAKTPKKLPQNYKYKKANEEDVDESPILIGDYVRIIGQQTIGEVEDIKNNKALVLANSVKVSLPLSQLVKVSRKEAKQQNRPSKQNTYGNVINDLNSKSANFKPSVDLRGKRAEDSLNIVKTLIDEAILLSVYELKILHGKGNGILRKVIREYLRSVDEVKSFRDEHVERGGDGITLVFLK